MRWRAGLLCLSLIAFCEARLSAAPPTFTARQVIPLLFGYAAVGVGDVNGDGEMDIVTASEDINTLNSQLRIQFGTAKGSYRQGPVIDLAYEFYPSSVVIGDFNQDGLTDIAVLGVTLDIFLQQPTGSFVLTTYPAPGRFDMVAADINRDGLLDLVIATSAGTAVLLNRGGAQFQPAVYVNSVVAQSVKLVDLNHDKTLDLITSFQYQNGSGSFTEKLLVQLGDGHGNFHAVASQPQLKGSIVPEIAVADFNHDGNPDIALISNASEIFRSVSILDGNGDGTFTPGFSTALPNEAPTGTSILAADTNGDGLPDFLVVSSNDYHGPADLVVFENTGQASFNAGLYSIQPNAYSGLLVRQGAGVEPEVIIVPSQLSGSFVTVLRSDGQGGFAGLETVAAANPPSTAVAGDFNQDGKLDLVGSTATGVVTYLNTGNDQHLFAPLSPFPLSGDVLVEGDFNDDGRLDVAVLYNLGVNGARGQTLSGNGDGTFALPSKVYLVGPSPFEATAADMNGDGTLDLVTGYPSVALGIGNGTFAAALKPNVSCDSLSILSIADFNKDGKPDVLTACFQGQNNQTIDLYIGNGDGTFKAPVNAEEFGTLVSVATGDFNGDGIPDIAVTTEPDFIPPQLTIFFGRGDGTFLDGPITNLPTLAIQNLTPGDFNGDGVLDVAVFDIYDDVFSVLAGNGDGTFQQPRSFGLDGDPTCLLSGPFQAGRMPGYQDLIFCTDGGIKIALNTTP